MREKRVFMMGPQPRGMGKNEIVHLTIAFFVLSLAFAISFAGGFQGLRMENFPTLMGISMLAVGTAFLFHEIAHRNLARKYGCWAEFRMWTWGLMMAIFFSFMGFVFAAPGAVVISGHMTKEQNGKISAAGPATNWIVGTAFLLASYALFWYGYGIYGFILAFVSFVNLFIGGFNLLPFGPLDGAKILRWNVKNYVLLALLIVGTLILGRQLGPFSGFI